MITSRVTRTTPCTIGMLRGHLQVFKDQLQAFSP